MFTEYVYEGDRVVGSVQYREPEWSTGQVDLMLAQSAWERELDENGIPIGEATNPEASKRGGEFYFRAGVRTENPETHEVVYAPLTNFATKARKDAEDAYKDTYPDASLNGMYWPVTKVERSAR